MSTLLNNTNFGITLEIQKIMATFLDNIVVKTSFICMPTFFRLRLSTELELQSKNSTRCL